MADVLVNALTPIVTEPISTDSIVCVNRSTNEGEIIDYNLLADKILDKLTSKTFSSLTTTSKLLTGGINELDTDIGTITSALAAITSGTSLISQDTTAANTWTNLATITLQAGVHILIGCAAITGTSKGLTLRFSHSTSYRSSVSSFASNINFSACLVGYANLTQQTTITLDGYGYNSPELKAPYPFLNAIRLK